MEVSSTNRRYLCYSETAQTDLMMTPELFDEAVAKLVARGYAKDNAIEIANAVGDDIEEEAGQWIVRDDQGNIITRIDPL